MLIRVLQTAVSVMDICVGNLETTFLALSNQRATMKRVIQEFWYQSDYCKYSADILLNCTTCSTPRTSIFLNCVNNIVNILLNNYSKSVSDVQHRTSVAKKALKFS